MNTELKAIIAALLGIEVVGMDIVKKDASTIIMADAMALLPKALAAVSNMSDLHAEIAALKTPANEQDLLAYVAGLFTSSDAKTQGIVNAAVPFILSAAALVQAIEA